MNLTADVKPFSTPLVNSHCERSVFEPKEIHYYPTHVRQLNSNTVSEHLFQPVNAEMRLNNVTKSEAGRGDCALERHKGSPALSGANVLNTKEARGTSYNSQFSAGTHRPKVESYSHVRNGESEPYIVQPASVENGRCPPQSNGVASSDQPGHLGKRAERFDVQSFPCSPAQLSYPYPCFIAYPPRYHEVPSTVAVELPSGRANQAFPLKRPEETWDLVRPMYPVYGYPWNVERRPFVDGNGQCGATPMKDFPVYREEDGRPSFHKDDVNRDKHRTEATGSNYPSTYEVERQAMHREVQLRGGRYVASTAGSANIHEQHIYGSPRDQGSGYDRQNWTQNQKPQSHHKLSSDVETPQNSREQHSVTSLRGNSQVVAYIAEGRYNGLAEDACRIEPMRYSPVIVDCYSLANAESPTKDSATPSEPAKSPGVPSMAFYDDRIHHQTVGKNYHDFHAHAPHTSQSAPVRVQPRDTAEPCAEDVRNQRSSPASNDQPPRAKGSWKAEMSCHISFRASVEEDRTSRDSTRDQWSRAWSSMDSQGLLQYNGRFSNKTPSVQSAASPCEYRSGPHVTNCDENSTSQRPFPGQRDQGLPAPVRERTSPERTTVLAKHGAVPGPQVDNEKAPAALHSTNLAVSRKKRHSYPDNQPRSSKAARRANFSRLSPDITQLRRDENTPNPFEDLAGTASARERSGVEPRAQLSFDEPDPKPRQIRITSQGGVISVESVSSQNPGSSPMRPCGEPQSPQAPLEQTARESPDSDLAGESGNTEDQCVDDSSSCTTPEEVPDLAEYAKAFNITDIDECDLDESPVGSDDCGGDEHGGHTVDASDHGVCLCSNPFCCGSLSRSRNHFNKFLGPVTKEKRFPCRFCGRRFAHLSTLQNHVRVHTGDRPYQCKYCGKSFAQSGVLKTHLRTHTGDKPFQCPFCGRLFAQSTTLTNHLRIHTGHKPFVCKYCSKAFSQPSTLRKHEISHTNERPFPCKVCGRAFVQQSTLNNHMRSHTGQKPYKCPFCGRGFAQLSTMDRHLKIHTSFRYKPHQCPYCDKDFSYLSNLTNHLQTHNKPLTVVS